LVILSTGFDGSILHRYHAGILDRISRGLLLEFGATTVLSSLMPLQSGKKLGPYVIGSLLGAGGMGEVYRATDSRLNRKVAIKVLPEQLASDPQRLERFEREAKVVSSLNHPRICTLHDIGEQDGTHFLVMELVDGETLESRLSRGRLPLTTALEYAIQISDGLDNAHRQGVIHRDLKPANIMLTSSGIKLLDFGLAKLKNEAVPITTSSQAATVDKSLTVEGTIVGTLQYMAPEQLEGQEADARSDIFSLGVILYEMLSGKPAFAGSSAAGLIASILKTEPPPPSASEPVPPALEHLIRLCLAKKRSDRWQTAHDVTKQLEWIRESKGVPAAVSAAKTRKRNLVLVGAALIVVIAVVALTYPRSPAPAGRRMQFAVSLPEGIRFSVGEDFVRSASISPDGEQIVFTGLDQATGRALLYVRPVGVAKATPLEGTEDGNSIFWSPDSASIGFVADGKLQTVSLSGGTPREVGKTSGNAGASWNKNDVILASLKNPGPIFKVIAGSAPTPITTLDPTTEIDHRWPQFLEDGDRFLYMAAGLTAAENKIYVSSLRAPQTRTLVLNGVAAFAYAYPNYVIYLKSGKLLAQEFDRDGFTLIGKPTTLANNALPPFSASRTGAVTYRTNPPTPSPLVWIRTDGSVIENALPPGYYTDPVISPDGSEVAYATTESIERPLNVAILNLASRTSRNLTVGDTNDRAPVWSPNGKEIAFLSQRPDAPGMYRKSANGIGAGELILPFPGVLWPYQWVGTNLIYFAGVSGANDVWMLSTDNFKAKTALLQSSANEVDGAVSPDGKWFVYSSNETGRWEIYLTTFPVSGTKLPITTRGGTDPLWARDGKKLYYVKPATGELVSVTVIPGNPPQFGTHSRIYRGPLEYPSAHSYDLDPKGDRILVAPSFVPQGDITVLLNWASSPN